MRILDALSAGEPGARIAAREGVSSQRVNRIRHEAAALPLAAIMDRITRAQAGSKGRSAGSRPHAGRPGYERLDQLAAAIGVDDEAVFELATLVISREVQIATVAVREGRLSDYKAAKDGPDPERLEKENERLLAQLGREFGSAASTPVFWTPTPHSARRKVGHCCASPPRWGPLF